MLSAGSWVPIMGSFDFGFSRTDPANSAVVDPLAKHELILVFDVGVDEIAQQSAFDAVVGLSRIVDRSVGHAATDKAMSIVASARLSLSGDGLASRIDAAYVRTDRAAQAPGIARTIGVHVLEVVQLLGRYSTRRTVGVWR